MTAHAFMAMAELALAIGLLAVTVSTLRSGRRPARARSWLFFAAASMTLVVRTSLDAFGTTNFADASALFELVTIALFAVGFVLLYGADRERMRTIETHAEHDATTGLLNRRAFREVVSARLHKAGPDARSALAVLDLDGFKAVNDSRGHPVGDHVLELVATAIRANLRANDIAARYGGDEFIVFLDGCGLPEAQRILQRIRTIVATVTGTVDASVTASVGLVASTLGRNDLDDLIAAADRALIEVKQSGKDQIRVADLATS